MEEPATVDSIKEDDSKLDESLKSSLDDVDPWLKNKLGVQCESEPSPEGSLHNSDNESISVNDSTDKSQWGGWPL